MEIGCFIIGLFFGAIISICALKSEIKNIREKTKHLEFISDNAKKWVDELTRLNKSIKENLKTLKNEQI
jgi:FtsZ-binding cell division protein ZapB